MIQVVPPSAPVNVPEDAIILPYDPEWKNGVKDADKLLVPYDKYVELWNRAYPDKKIETRPRRRPLRWPERPTRRCWKRASTCC